MIKHPKTIRDIGNPFRKKQYLCLKTTEDMFLLEDCDKFYKRMTADETFAKFIESLYNATYDTIDAETKTALASYIDGQSVAEDTAYAFASLPEIALGENTAASVLGCKKHIAKRAYKYTAKFIDLAYNEIVFDVYKNRNKIENLTSMIIDRIASEHIRIVHSFETYFDHCDRSVLRLYYLICMTDREDAKYPSLGEEKTSTLFSVLQEIKALIEEATSSPASYETKQREYKWAKAGIPADGIESLSIKYGQLGHFPMFSAISLIINSFKERDRRIIQNGLNIYERNDQKTLDEIASEEEITRERARQLRMGLLDRLGSCISVMAETCLDNYRYYPLNNYSIRQIAKEEDIPFNDNFIVWAACLSSSELHLIGTPDKAFLKNSGAKLFAVPSNLRQDFDFDAFVESIDSALAEKRDHDRSSDLEAYIQTFRKRNAEEQVSGEILNISRDILERGYSDNLRYTIHFPANAKMNIPDIIEEVIRNAGKPMTAEEIAEVFAVQFPDISQSIDKIRANARRNPNIATISRNSTYTMKEWADTPSKRGGTLRELAEEYLLSLDEPIAKTTDICRYVAQFRPTVKEPNLRSNLLLESTGKFTLYDKDGAYCIGLSDREYSPSYKIIGKQKTRLPFETNINLLDSFIKENGRFPSSSGVPDEERRLNRFYGYAKSCLDKGLLQATEAAQISRIETLYGHLKVKKTRQATDSMPQILFSADADE